MKENPVFWVVAGTTEGRLLAEKLSESKAIIHVSLATDYGKWFLENKKNLFIQAGRLNQEEMVSFITANKIDCIIDATHPYAQEVTRNIIQAGRQTSTKYIRQLRPVSERGNFIYARDCKHAAEILSTMQGKIFLTCGSKEIGAFTGVPDFANRIYIRMLTMPSAIEKCIDLGYKPPNIICMQGPFSAELNLAMMKAIGADILVTKDSGDTGGFAEKIEAAGILGITVIVIGRPPEDNGLLFMEVVEKLKEDYYLDFV